MIKKDRNSLKKRIKKMEHIARLSGHVGKIKPSHMLNIPELRELIHPHNDVAFHVFTIKTVEDGLVPLVMIDIFYGGRLISIDLSRLELSKEIQIFLTSLNILPRQYFHRIKNAVSDKFVPEDINIVSDVEEYYPTCYPN